jgi:hypothetical protein
MSTSQKMIPTKNATDAHAQNFVANDELPQFIIKHSHNALAQCTPLEKLHVFGLCIAVE